MYIEKEEFKIGDTVVCIKPDTSNPGITEGSLYTILKLDSVPHYELGIIVENDYGDRRFYYAHQFIKFYQIEKETEMALTCTMNAEQIRDEILRIDVRIEEAKKDIKNAEKKRNSLVEKLREKGFTLLGSENSASISKGRPTEGDTVRVRIKDHHARCFGYTFVIAKDDGEWYAEESVEKI